MSDGVITVLIVVAVFVLVETILPRCISALRHRWKRRRHAKRVSTVAESSVSVAEEKDPIVHHTTATDNHNADHVTTADVNVNVTNDEADRLWAEAREMPHAFIPNPDNDGEYLTKVYAAAKLGHFGAMTKLGEYACRRGAIVEAYYWTALADLKGAKGLDVTLRKMKTLWLSEGCQPEYSNVYAEFSEQQSAFARALLRIRSSVDAPHARVRMRELANSGLEEAQLYLGMAAR